MMRILPAGLTLLASRAAAVPVIFDTDLGGGIHDTWVLGMLLNGRGRIGLMGAPHRGRNCVFPELCRG